MTKIRLSLDALDVASFSVVADVEAGRGAVEGASATLLATRCISCTDPRCLTENVGPATCGCRGGD